MSRYYSEFEQEDEDITKAAGFKAFLRESFKKNRNMSKCKIIKKAKLDFCRLSDAKRRKFYELELAAQARANPRKRPCDMKKKAAAKKYSKKREEIIYGFPDSDFDDDDADNDVDFPNQPQDNTKTCCPRGPRKNFCCPKKVPCARQPPEIPCCPEKKSSSCEDQKVKTVEECKKECKKDICAEKNKPPCCEPSKGSIGFMNYFKLFRCKYPYYSKCCALKKSKCKYEQLGEKAKAKYRLMGCDAVVCCKPRCPCPAE